MASLAEALKDRKGFPDAQEITIGDTKFTLGELRGFQEASGIDLQKQLESERQKLTAREAEISKQQEEVVNLWQNLQGQKAKIDAAPKGEVVDWKKDPFYEPIAKYLDSDVIGQIKELNDKYSKVQQALGLGVKYIMDGFSEMRYAALPEDFRKEHSLEQTLKSATDKKFLDSGGVPDVRKVYEEWQTPRQRNAEIEAIRKEEREKVRQEMLQSGLARPSGMPVSAPVADPNAPKTIKESFNRLKENPEFLSQIYNLTGQA